MRTFARVVVALLGLVVPAVAQARGLERVRFIVVDPASRQLLALACVTVEDPSSARPPLIVSTALLGDKATTAVDLRTWMVGPAAGDLALTTLITLPAGTSVILHQQGQPPTPDIYVRVTATRLVAMHANPIAPGTTLGQKAIQNKAGVGGTMQRVIEGTTGVAADSAGQQHVRGEHAELSYVVDGIPVPDTLSGRQGAVVVPSTIQSLEIITGGFAPEFGGQTAAVLNVTTLPGARKARTDVAVEAGSYDTTNGDVTAVGPISPRASYVLDAGATRTRNFQEPEQPDDQAAHNTGSTQSYFGKLRLTPSARDVVMLTANSDPTSYQNPNRTGLPASFALAGEGYGFLGLRNANGVRPDVTPDTAGLLGAQVLPLPSQQAAGMDINLREVSDFGTLSWRRQLGANTSALFALTLLHAGQEVRNSSPPVDVLNLPIDNSVEYNPTATRNIHHTQLMGSISRRAGRHQLKAGVLADDQSGDESYHIVAASQLALDALAVSDAPLAPAGSVRLGANGQPVLDVNGNPVYVPTSSVVPTLRVHRSGFYRAAYAQDTWQATRRLAVNYGLRFDWYKQSQNLGQPVVDVKALSPRVNFSYNADRFTVLRWSYNRLLNTPPVAQGAVVGAPIQPETIDQYDVSVEHQVAPGQTLSLAYYAKQIRNQVDTGLLIPGVQIGLYSAVNFQYGGVHGLELAYDITPRRGVGWDANLSYTYSTARPNGLDNAGARVPDFNDHDQRQTVGLHVAYDFKGGASAGLTLYHGSGLASSVVPPSDKRTPRTRMDLELASGPRLFRGRGGLGLRILNLFDDRRVMNFQSAFSGTRFQQARTVLLSANGTF